MSCSFACAVLLALGLGGHERRRELRVNILQRHAKLLAALQVLGGDDLRRHLGRDAGLVGHIGHERPKPPFRHDVAVLLQALVHLAHGVVVHLHLGGQAPHRGQLIARQVEPRGDEVDEAVFQLKPDGNGAGGIQLEQIPGRYRLA